MFDAILNRAPMVPVRLNPALPAKLEEIIKKALEKDRRLRYQSAAEMSVDLRRLQREIDSGVTGNASTLTPSAGTGVLRAAPTMAQPPPRARWALAAYMLRPTLPPARITGYTQRTHDGLAKSFAGQAISIVLTDGSRIYVAANSGGSLPPKNDLAYGANANTIPCPEIPPAAVVE